MRRPIPLLTLVMLLFVLAVSADTEGAATIQKPQAIAFAHAVNLRDADVPGFSVPSVQDREIAADRRLEHVLRGCVTPAGTQRALAEVSSSGFGREASSYEQSVSSAVSVARAPALLAAKQSTELRGARVRKCLSQTLTKLLRVQKDPPVLKLGPVSISSLPVPVRGAASSFGVRIAAKIKVSVFIVHVYVDVLGFVRSSAEVTLLTSGAPQPFPAATEKQLFSLLLTRAEEKRI